MMQAPMLIQQQNPKDSRLRAITDNMIAQGSSTAPVQSVGEAIARALTGVVGGYASKQQDERIAARDADSNKAISDALMQGRDGGLDASIAALQGNPDTAAFANNLAIQQLLAGEKNQQALALAQQKGDIDYQNAIRKEMGLGPIQAQNAAAKAEALLPIQTRAAAEKARVTLPFDVQKATAIEKATQPYKMERAAASKPTVNIQNLQEKEETKALVKRAADYTSSVIETGRSARKTLGDVKALRNINPETGQFAPVKARFSAVAEALGIGDGEAASDYQSANAIVQRFGFGQLKGEGQVSNFERELIQATLPRLQNTQQAFNFTVDRMENALRFQVLEDDLRRQYEKEQGTIVGVDDYVADNLSEIPSVVPAPDGGLPIFFVEFERSAKKQNPKITLPEIISEWQQGASQMVQ